MCVRAEGKLQCPVPPSIKIRSLLPNPSNPDWPWNLLWPAEGGQQPLHVCSKPGPQMLLHDVPYFLGRLPLHMNKLCLSLGEDERACRERFQEFRPSLASPQAHEQAQWRCTEHSPIQQHCPAFLQTQKQQ